MMRTDDLMSLVHEVLGDNLMGAYLHGSDVLGGLRPHSDIDVFLVNRSSLTQSQRRTLVDGLIQISMSPRPVELIIVVQSEVRPWRFAPVCDFLYGQWLLADYERGVLPQPEPMADLAPLITMVLLGNRSLAGPPPSEVLDPVPQDDLRRAIVAGIPGLLANLDGDTRNVLLTFARIWSTLATGTIRSKEAAVDWAFPACHPSTVWRSPGHARSTSASRTSTGMTCASRSGRMSTTSSARSGGQMNPDRDDCRPTRVGGHPHRRLRLVLLDEEQSRTRRQVDVPNRW